MYTTHGHQIPGTPEDDKKPDKVWRCGGVRICSKCYGETKFVTARINEVLSVLEIEDAPEIPCESNLVNHARTELRLIGEDEHTTVGILRVIQAFADMGHSGGSASVAIPMITNLLQYKNLSPLTDDPSEWVFHDGSVAGGNGVWQNTRNSEAFSNDGGKTYWLISEREIDHSRGKLHTSTSKEQGATT